MPAAIYLIRHCQAVSQAPQAPLTPLGLTQAETLCNFARVPLAGIVSSPYARAVATARPLATMRALAVATDPRLIEHNVCPDDRPDWRHHLARFFEDLDYALPGGETSHAAMTRGRAAIETLFELDAPVAAVTHGKLLTLILGSVVGGYSLAEWQKLTNTDVFRLSRDGGVERLWWGESV